MPHAAGNLLRTAREMLPVVRQMPRTARHEPAAVLAVLPDDREMERAEWIWLFAEAVVIAVSF
ncbi:MAG: hypothetical protein EA408_13860 [Marinilabiliales bacterium]|nr:MAG: hypothetical protein EA408_13860 [Marinilabiliales bacterium]